MRNIHPATRTCAALLSIAALVPAALAQPSADLLGPADTVWNCWYNHDTTFRCRLAQAPDDPGGVDADPGLSASRPSLYPRRGPLPAIVKTIRDHPARLRGRTITIPLFSPPIDIQFSAELVHSVMCGRRPMCRIRIFRSLAAVVQEYEDDPARGK